MANFNRERIRERQPHAKGGGAFGYFEVTGDVSAYTMAAVFQPGIQTDTLIRFTTVAGSGQLPRAERWRFRYTNPRHRRRPGRAPLPAGSPVQLVGELDA